MSEELKFAFSPNLIDRLGIEMYDSPTRAIAELIANTWDADATEVYIELPSEPISKKSVIVIRDNGNGIKSNEIESKFLNIGWNRREKGEKSPKRKRELIGHKGIGKFAGFGLADVLEIYTVNEEEQRLLAFKIDRNELHKSKSLTEFKISIDVNKDVNDIPEKDLEVIYNVEFKKIKGTTVILRDIRIKHGIPTVEHLKTSIAKRFRPAPDFQIFVNGESVSKIQIENRRVMEINEIVEEKIKLESGEEKVIKVGKVEGFIALARKTLSYSPGVLVHARSRAVEMNTQFNITKGITGQIYISYLYGEIQAEWLDTKEKDLIRTDRGGIRWKTDEGKAFEIWGQGKIRKICADEAKSVEKEKLTWVEKPEFHSRYYNLTPTYRREVKRVIDSVVHRMVGTKAEKFIDNMTNLLLLAFENRDIYLILQTLTESDVKDLETFSNVLKEWSIVELNNMVPLVEGRLALIEKLKEYIDNPETLEFPTMQKFLEKYPWLINPMYDVLSADKELSKTLNKMAVKDLEKKFEGKLTEEELRKKPDFVCLGAMGKYIVVEIKRPQEKVNDDEIQQLQKYWLYICDELDMTSPEVTGLFIAHDFDERAKNVIKNHRALSALKYSDLWRQARNLHKDFLDALEKRKEEVETGIAAEEIGIKV